MITLFDASLFISFFSATNWQESVRDQPIDSFSLTASPIRFDRAGLFSILEILQQETKNRRLVDCPFVRKASLFGTHSQLALCCRRRPIILMSSPAMAGLMGRVMEGLEDQSSMDGMASCHRLFDAGEISWQTFSDGFPNLFIKNVEQAG